MHYYSSVICFSRYLYYSKVCPFFCFKDGMDTLSQSLTRFSKYIVCRLILSYLFHCITNNCYACQNLDKEAVSNISYFGAFHRMFVHFHFYITNEAACESLHDLDFRSQYLTTCCNAWTLDLHYHVFQYIEMYLLLKYLYYMYLTFSTAPPSPITKLVLSHIFIFNNHIANSIIFIYQSTFMNKLSNFKHFL